MNHIIPHNYQIIYQDMHHEAQPFQITSDCLLRYENAPTTEHYSTLQYTTVLYSTKLIRTG